LPPGNGRLWVWGGGVGGGWPFYGQKPPVPFSSGPSTRARIPLQGRDGLVQFDDVLLRYGAGPDVLQKVSFSLAPGSFHFLVGSSGAGKSSLLRVMYLALRPIGGRASQFGRGVGQLSPREITEMRRRIGVVFQDFRLIEHLSALDNVALPLRILGQRESEVQKN